MAQSPPAIDPDAAFAYLARLDEIKEALEPAQQAILGELQQAVETVHGEALRLMLRAVNKVPEARAALRAAVEDPLLYAVLRKHGLVKPSLTERVEAALDAVRPMLAGHGGDVELIEIAPPALKVRFLGNCNGCPASELTFHAGVKKAIEQVCPEITDIVQIKSQYAGANQSAVMVSPFDEDAGWSTVTTLDALPEGGTIAAELAGRMLLMARIDGQVTAFDNACAHLGLPLDGATITAGIITCTHHGFRYDLTSGECLTVPEVALFPHQVRVHGGNVDVRLAS